MLENRGSPFQQHETSGKQINITLVIINKLSPRQSYNVEFDSISSSIVEITMMH